MVASNPPLEYGATPRNTKSHNFFRRANTLSAFCSLSVSRIRRIDNGTMPPTPNAALHLPATGRATILRLAPIPEAVLVYPQKRTNIAGSPIALEVQS